jgi:predicted dehydrogenase
MKVLVAGLGSIGQRHVRNLRTLLGGDVEIIAYRVRSLPHVLTEQREIEPGSGVETKYGIKPFADLDEALAQRPAAAFICNPTSLHQAAALSVARAGCHLFIEKPLSNRCDGVEELIRTVDENGLVALVGYQMRFHPCLQRLHSLLRQNAIGRILSARVEVGEYLPDAHPYEDYRRGYAARSDLGGGVILSQIHELDYIYWLFGLPRRVTTSGGHLSSLEIDVEDTASSLMECIVDGAPVPVELHQDFVRRPAVHRCRLIGDAGRILVDLDAPSLQVFDDRGHVVERTDFDGFQRNQLFLDELRHFLACLRGDERPIVTLRDAAQSLRMALAARQSLVTGQAVDLN